MSIAKFNLVLVRHGLSIANEENRIVSDPANGAIGDSTASQRYGLSATGKAMVADSAASLADYIQGYAVNDHHPIQIRIVCSPFDRTRDTADIVYQTLQTKWSSTSFSSQANVLSRRTIHMDPPVPHPDLVERYFGDFEKQAPSSALYQSVWQLDAQDPGHTQHNVESLEHVMRRQRRVLRAWATETNKWPATTADNGCTAVVDQWIIYVGHGDPLQILQTNMRGWALERHREMPHHEVAEWRHVEWCPSLASHYGVAPIDLERRAKALAHQRQDS